MKLITIFARYGTQQYIESDVRLRNELETLIPGIERDFLIVDTALAKSVDIHDQRGVHVVGSKNTHWEFGAWSTAINYLGSRIYDYDYILLTTSACFNGYIDFHGFLSEHILDIFHGRAAALGHIEVYNLPVYFFGVKFQAWLRSSYIILQPHILSLIGDPVTVKDTDCIFTNTPSEPFHDHAPVCQQYRSYIHSWLTGDGTGQGVTWHSRFTLDADSFPYYKDKAKAIFNEMNLSNRIVASGCSLVDMTWVHRTLAKRNTLSTIPSWHEQLSQRGTGHESIIEG